MKKIAHLRLTLMMGLFALLLPLLAACGGDNTAPDAGIQPTQPAATSGPGSDAAPTSPSEDAPTAAAPQPSAPTDSGELTFPLQTPYMQVGVVAHLYYTDRERALTLANAAGFDWVRQQVVWKDIEGPTPGSYAWDELDKIVNAIAAGNQKLLVSVVRSPSFYSETNGLPSDPTTLGAFVEAIAQRYGNKIGAYEIWNEQNLAVENGGRVTVEDAGKYVELLVESYKRIKAVTPEAYVLAGAPSSSGVNDPSLAVSDENYYRAMYEYKDGLIKDYFDAQAVHPGGAANPPDTLFPENPSFIEGCTPAPDRCWNDDETHYFRHLENVRRFMEEEGVGDHQIWITEFGWATENDTPGYEFGNFVSQEQQADYIVSAIDRAYEEYRDDQGQPWIGVMFLWNLNFAVLKGAEGQPLHEQASFGILAPDWSPRPSFLALQGYLAQMKQEQGR